MTRSCKDRDEARRYLRWLHDPAIMAGVYFEAGGQPGSRAAWTSKLVNAAANDFFSDTLLTMNHAFLRPRFAGFVPFMKAAGHEVRAFLLGDLGQAACRRRLLDDYARAFEAAGRPSATDRAI